MEFGPWCPLHPLPPGRPFGHAIRTLLAMPESWVSTMRSALTTAKSVAYSAADLLTRRRGISRKEVHPEQLLLFGQSSTQLWAVLAEHGADVRRNGLVLTEAQFTRETEPFEVQITLDGRR